MKCNQPIIIKEGNKNWYFPCDRPAKYFYLEEIPMCGIHARKLKGSPDLKKIERGQNEH